MKLHYANTSKFLLGLALFIATASFAQDNITTKKIIKFDAKPYIIPGATMFVSGMLDGTIETINWHYEDGFKRALPNVNDRFWNPAISWANKYKNGNQNQGPAFIGSTTVFVGATDAYHALRTARNFVDAFTISFYINRTCHQAAPPKFAKILLDAVIFAAIRDIGFSTTYSLLFREGNHE